MLFMETVISMRSQQEPLCWFLNQKPLLIRREHFIRSDVCDCISISWSYWALWIRICLVPNLNSQLYDAKIHQAVLPPNHELDKTTLKYLIIQLNRMLSVHWCFPLPSPDNIWISKHITQVRDVDVLAYIWFSHTSKIPQCKAILRDNLCLS